MLCRQFNAKAFLGKTFILDETMAELKPDDKPAGGEEVADAQSVASEVPKEDPPKEAEPTEPPKESSQPQDQPSPNKKPPDGEQKQPEAGDEEPPSTPENERPPRPQRHYREIVEDTRAKSPSPWTNRSRMNSPSRRNGPQSPYQYSRSRPSSRERVFRQSER